MIPIQSDLLIYVYFHSIALTSRKQRRNNDFPLTSAPIPIKEVLPQLLKKQLFVFFVLLIVLSTVLEESYMIKDPVSDRMQRESAARMEQYIASVSRMEPST